VPHLAARGARVKSAKSWLPGLAVLVAVLLTLLPPRPSRGFDVAGFCRLPVLEGGRVKPLDTVARNSLLAISGRQSVPDAGRRLQADEWLLDVLFRPSVAGTQPIFLVDDPDVRGLAGLRPSPGRRFSFESLEPRLPEIARQAYAASLLDPSGRSRFQGAVLDLYRRLDLYCQLANAGQPAGGGLDRPACFRPLFPLAGQPPEAWQSIGEGRGAGTHPALALLDVAGAAYAAGDAAAFNRATEDLGRLSASLRPEFQAKASHEALFNRAEPFYLGMVIYATALLVLFASWAWRPGALQPAARSLLTAGLLVHTAGLASRILLQGRPPVTNLYSSAVFVGWVAVLLGTGLEWAQRRGFAMAVACTVGFASLLVAHHLARGGDTMEMMRAVLDSNLWLTAHVVTITIGYGGTFLAGALAIAHTLRRHLVRRPEAETGRALLDTTYGVLCFSLLFCLAGTVLGGIWADQSWGRFWGWDPKENGALLVVLWNALILHARLGKVIRERGLMAMAIGGNIVTSLAWFGVNMLGVGLHAYGFTEKGAMALGGFILSQVLLAGLCLLPRRCA